MSLPTRRVPDGADSDSESESAVRPITTRLVLLPERNKKRSNGFMMYREEIQRQLRYHRVYLGGSELTSHVGVCWDGLTDEEKRSYKTKAKQRNSVVVSAPHSSSSEWWKRSRPLREGAVAKRAGHAARSKKKYFETNEEEVKFWPDPTDEDVAMQRYFDRANIKMQWQFNKADPLEKKLSLIAVQRLDGYDDWDETTLGPCEIAVLSFKLTQGVVDRQHFVITSDYLYDEIGLSKICNRIYSTCEETGARRIYCLVADYNIVLATVETLKSYFCSGVSMPSQLQLHCVEDLFEVLCSWYNVAPTSGHSVMFSAISSLRFPADLFDGQVNCCSVHQKPGKHCAVLKTEKMWYLLMSLLAQRLPIDGWESLRCGMRDWKPLQGTSITCADYGAQEYESGGDVRADSATCSSLIDDFRNLKVAIDYDEDGSKDDDYDDDYEGYSRDYEKPETSASDNADFPRVPEPVPTEGLPVQFSNELNSSSCTTSDEPGFGPPKTKAMVVQMFYKYMLQTHPQVMAGISDEFKKFWFA